MSTIMMAKAAKVAALVVHVVPFAVLCNRVSFRTFESEFLVFDFLVYTKDVTKIILKCSPFTLCGQAKYNVEKACSPSSNNNRSPYP